jgi:hypothetical protein
LVHTTVVPGLILRIAGSNDEAIILTSFVGPEATGVADWVATWVACAGRFAGGVWIEHPAISAMHNRRMNRRAGNFSIKDRVGAGVVILFLSRTGCRPVHGNRS